LSRHEQADAQAQTEGISPQDRIFFWPLCGHSERSEKPSALALAAAVRPVLRPRFAFPWSDPAANYKL